MSMSMFFCFNHKLYGVNSDKRDFFPQFILLLCLSVSFFCQYLGFRQMDLLLICLPVGQLMHMPASQSLSQPESHFVIASQKTSYCFCLSCHLHVSSNPFTEHDQPCQNEQLLTWMMVSWLMVFDFSLSVMESFIISHHALEMSLTFPSGL